METTVQDVLHNGELKVVFTAPYNQDAIIAEIYLLNELFYIVSKPIERIVGILPTLDEAKKDVKEHLVETLVC